MPKLCTACTAHSSFWHGPSRALTHIALTHTNTLELSINSFDNEMLSTFNIIGCFFFLALRNFRCWHLMCISLALFMFINSISECLFNTSFFASKFVYSFAQVYLLPVQNPFLSIFRPNEIAIEFDFSTIWLTAFQHVVRTKNIKT